MSELGFAIAVRVGFDLVSFKLCCHMSNRICFSAAIGEPRGFAMFAVEHLIARFCATEAAEAPIAPRRAPAGEPCVKNCD